VSASASGAGGGSEYADESADFEDYGDYYGDDNGEGGGGAGADGSMMEGGEDGAGGKEQEVDGITKIGGIFICMRCGYKTTKCSNAREHYLRKHLPLQLSTCHICQKQFKNPIDRDRHRSKEHGITKRMMKEAVQQSKIPLAPSTDDIY